VIWKVVYTKRASKDAKKLTQSNLKNNAQSLIDLLSINPLQSPPPFKSLVGSLSGAMSRRINFQHRLVYQILHKEKIVKIVSMWSHYE
jgi:toxin YoeB